MQKKLYGKIMISRCFWLGYYQIYPIKWIKSAQISSKEGSSKISMPLMSSVRCGITIQNGFFPELNNFVEFTYYGK